jgi:hypothetical protein
MRLDMITATLTVSAFLISAASAETQTTFVASPRIKGNAVDQCMSTAGPCGQEAADAFCRRINYATATAFSTKLSLKPTTMLGSGEHCTTIPGAVAAKTCKALTQVTCVRELFEKVPGLPKSLPD